MNTQFAFLPKLLPPRNLGKPDYVAPLPDSELLEFLANDTPEEEAELNSLWQTTGLPNILNAVPKVKVIQHARKPVEYFFDEAAGKYRYIASGRVIPESRIRLGMLRLSNESARMMRDLTLQLSNKQITLRQWYSRMRTLMKQEYKSAWLASIGGQANYDRRQAALFGRAVAPQYRWLNRFLEDIQSGRQKLNGSALTRASMYGRAGNVIYQNNLLRVAMENGFNWTKRILGETDHHCHTKGERKGCVELARGGWTRIENATPIGDAACYSNCLCHFKFQKSTPIGRR